MSSFLLPINQVFADIQQQPPRKMMKTTGKDSISPNTRNAGAMPFTPDASPATFPAELIGNEQDVFSLMQPVAGSSPRVSIQPFGAHERSLSQPLLQSPHPSKPNMTLQNAAPWSRSFSVDDGFNSQYWTAVGQQMSNSQRAQQLQFTSPTTTHARSISIETLAYPSPSLPYRAVVGDEASRRTPFQQTAPLSAESLMSPPLVDDGSVPAFVSPVMAHNPSSQNVFGFSSPQYGKSLFGDSPLSPEVPFLSRTFPNGQFNRAVTNSSQAAAVAAAVQSAMVAKAMTPRLNTTGLTALDELVSCSPSANPVLTTPKFTPSPKVITSVTIPRCESPSHGSPTAESKRKARRVKKAFCRFPGCTNAYYRNEHLIRHMRTHTGDKPFVCSHEGCGKSFSRSDNYASHLRSHDLAAAQGITQGLRRGGRKRKAHDQASSSSNTSTSSSIVSQEHMAPSVQA